MRIEWRGIDELEKALIKKSKTDFLEVATKSLTEMFNRADAMPYTPIKSGELRLSRGVSKDSFGYSKEYAPHVEYGHRLKNGGYVKGQFYLAKNAKKQQPIYKADLIKKMKED